jgi:hypothetical protein
VRGYVRVELVHSLGRELALDGRDFGQPGREGGEGLLHEKSVFVDFDLRIAVSRLF